MAQVRDKAHRQTKTKLRRITSERRSHTEKVSGSNDFVPMKKPGYRFSITGLSINCSCAENTSARMRTVLINDVSPDAAKIMLSTTN